MKKLRNDPSLLIEQCMEGYAAAHADVLRWIPGTHRMERAVKKAPGKVRVMMGNGGGHEPAVIGWVGKGMFDLDVVGEVFAAPSGDAIFDGIKSLAADGPVLLCVQNHAGDVLNAGMAMERVREEGLPAQSVLFYDDIASAPKDFREERRGIGGMLFYSKIVGALAEDGADMDQVIRMFEKVRDRTRTLSVAVTNCTHPISGLAMFDSLPEDEIEIGMGVHGEGGMNRMKLPTSEALAREILTPLIDDGEYKPRDRMLVMVNGAGGMTMMELSIFFRDIKAFLESQGMTVAGCKVGNFLTTQELSGVSVSLMNVDDEMLALWEKPCDAPAF